MDELIEAIREHSGMENDEIMEAGENGADAGWPGFTYTGDTVDFYEKHADLIWPILTEQADDMGEKHPLALIASFNTAGQVDNDSAFKNLLSWFALEEAGRYLAAQEGR